MLVLLAKAGPRDDDAENPLRSRALGVPIPAELQVAFERRFGVRLVTVYGSTEATIVAWNDRPDAKAGPVGARSPITTCE